MSETDSSLSSSSLVRVKGNSEMLGGYSEMRRCVDVWGVEDNRDVGHVPFQIMAPNIVSSSL